MGSSSSDRPRLLSRLGRTVLWSTLLAVGIGFFGCSAFTNSMLMFPSNHVISTDAMREAFVGSGVEVSGQEIEVYYREFGSEGVEPELYVLALTGNAGRAETMHVTTEAMFESWITETGAPKRVGVLALQYPGYGSRATGEASLTSMAQASVEALAFLRERAGSRPVFIHALSLGTTAALHSAKVASSTTVQGLIIEKPPNLGPLILGEHGWWNAWLIAGPMVMLLPDCVLSDTNAAAISDVPALFLIAELDRVVPERYAQQVFEAFTGQKRRVRLNGGHNSTVSARWVPELDEGLRWLWGEAIKARVEAPSHSD